MTLRHRVGRPDQRNRAVSAAGPAAACAKSGCHIEQVLVFLRNFYDILTYSEVCDPGISESYLMFKTNACQSGVLQLTNAGSQVQGTKDPDRQIRVDLADDLNGVARSEVGFLHDLVRLKDGRKTGLHKKGMAM